MKYNDAVRAAQQRERAGRVTQLPQASTCDLGSGAAGLHVLTRVEREPNSERERELARSLQLLAVFGDPVVREARVRGKGHEALVDPEQVHAALHVPAQDSFEVRYVLAYQGPDTVRVRQIGQPEGAIRDRR